MNIGKRLILGVLALFSLVAAGNVLAFGLSNLTNFPDQSAAVRASVTVGTSTASSTPGGRGRAECINDAMATRNAALHAAQDAFNQVPVGTTTIDRAARRAAQETFRAAIRTAQNNFEAARRACQRR